MTWHPLLLLAVALGVVVTVILMDPIPQDPNYYDFADKRAIIGIPNFLNVVSNLPFLAFGVLGTSVVMKNEETVGRASKAAWIVFFFSIALTAFGSGYFHWQPNNETLVWDRLPMTIGFMSLVSIIVSEYFSPKFGATLLAPLLLLGVASVAYWAFTESQGVGDLRPYAIVQFLPILLIPMIILLYRPGSDLASYLGWMIGFYVLAKLFEFYDFAVYAIGGAVSGHSIKHLAASLAPAALIFGLLRRRQAR